MPLVAATCCRLLLTPPHTTLSCVPQVDTELVYAYAKNKDLGPLEEFITGTHLANLQAVGDRWAGIGAGRQGLEGLDRGTAGPGDWLPAAGQQTN